VVKTTALEYLFVWSGRTHLDYLLQDDIARFVSDPTPPPQVVDIPEEGKSKAKVKDRYNEPERGGVNGSR
jgi:hypothetical protein